MDIPSALIHNSTPTSATPSPPPGPHLSTQAQDQAQQIRHLLDRLTAFLNESEGNVLLAALTKYQDTLLRAARPGGGVSGDNRPVGRPRAAEPRPRKTISNGRHVFQIIEFPTARDEDNARTVITLRHVGRDEAFTLTISKRISREIIFQCCKAEGLSMHQSSEELVGQFITLICYAGEPRKLLSGERLTD